ncbi:hypothetical protein OEZ71_16255 [Defluviimonas sp. WL0050]|uniref:Uncharacterized protein n=1 Tax=Albidovulum litorale TaxID=2984134 RepID=A0ABT2ZRR4_9RHOB|nr:hypothetical protein [Defluviimonas sp. WL0050]MCV2873851.1 hypothetical protein [Defluviimonas sp. WL0050]
MTHTRPVQQPAVSGLVGREKFFENLPKKVTIGLQNAACELQFKPEIALPNSANAHFFG